MNTRRFGPIVRRLQKNPRMWMGGIVIFFIGAAAVFAPYLTPFTPEDSDITRRLASPSMQSWLGFDLDGRDIMTSLLYGARVSLYIACATVFLNLCVGLLIGLISGFKLGFIDAFLMRLVDIFLAIPQILVALVLSTLLGSSINNIILSIAATGWAAAARLVRGQVLSLRERDYVHASDAIGASEYRLLFIHILPGVLTPLIVYATFTLSGVIIVESSLSFLGLGAQNGAPSWGALLGQGRSVMTEAPLLSIAPGVAIVLVVLALNFMGDALRDALDPRHEA